jgi:oxygen-dependent protoporphyrinogen oxidase
MADDGIYDVCIIGGGIAGLAAAWELRGRNFVVLEAGDRVGGRMRSEERGDYWLNVGGHLIEGPGSVMYSLAEQTGMEVRVAPGDALAIHLRGKTVTGGRPETYPLRLPMSLGGRLSFIKAGLKIRKAVRGYHAASTKREGEDAGAFRIRHLAYLGDRDFAAYLGSIHPDVEAIFGAVCERMTASMTEISAGCGAALFAHAWSGDNLLVRNIVGGSGRLPATIARKLGERVVTGARVEDVADRGDSVEIRLNVAGTIQELRARKAIVATPAHVTTGVVSTLPDDTRGALAEVRYGPYVVGGILTQETKPMPWDGLYAVATPGRSFNFLFNHANVVHAYSDTRRPGGSLMVYGGGSYARRIWSLSDDEIRERFTNDLYAIFPESAGSVKEILLQRWEHGYPYIRPGRHRVQPALEKPLGNVFLAGDYLDWATMESAARSGIDAARRAAAGLGAASAE